MYQKNRLLVNTLLHIFLYIQWTSIHTGQLAPIYNVTLIAQKIWKNECNCSREKLIHWHESERFPSFGIGHFIWLPDEKDIIFVQTFPEFINFAQKRGLSVPHWLIAQRYCPWNNRNEFLNDHNSARMHQLKDFLYASMPVQALFIIAHFEKTIPLIIAHCLSSNRMRIEKQLKLMQQSTIGMFSLIDYYNFKGSGINEKERYCDKGWGLLQVFNQMHDTVNSQETVEEFILSAQKVLEERVRNNPHDAVFLPGWRNRIQSYRNI